MNDAIKEVKLFLMDMDGTVYLGNNPIAGAFEALEYIRSHGRKICFLTNNSSRANITYREKLARVFNFTANENEVYTSAQATCTFLKNKHNGKKIFLLSPPDVRREFEEFGIPLDDEDPDIVVLCFDTTLTYEKLYKACKFINQGKLYVATHPDNFCPDPVCPMPDVGGFIAIIEKTLGVMPDVIIGKPYEEMANAVESKFGLRKEEIAMVGDRLYTDIKFGVNNGFKSILVMTGETDEKMLAESDIKPTLVLPSFGEVLKFLD